jgi:hypothetical protein
MFNQSYACRKKDTARPLLGEPRHGCIDAARLIPSWITDAASCRPMVAANVCFRCSGPSLMTAIGAKRTRRPSLTWRASHHVFEELFSMSGCARQISLHIECACAATHDLLELSSQATPCPIKRHCCHNSQFVPRPLIMMFVTRDVLRKDHEAARMSAFSRYPSFRRPPREPKSRHSPPE